MGSVVYREFLNYVKNIGEFDSKNVLSKHNRSSFIDLYNYIRPLIDDSSTISVDTLFKYDQKHDCLDFYSNNTWYSIIDNVDCILNDYLYKYLDDDLIKNQLDNSDLDIIENYIDYDKLGDHLTSNDFIKAHLDDEGIDVEDYEDVIYFLKDDFFEENVLRNMSLEKWLIGMDFIDFEWFAESVRDRESDACLDDIIGNLILVPCYGDSTIEDYIIHHFHDGDVYIYIWNGTPWGKK